MKDKKHETGKPVKKLTFEEVKYIRDEKKKNISLTNVIRK